MSGFERRLLVLEALSRKTAALYMAKVKDFFAWAVEHLPAKDLGQITRRDIESFLEWCFYQGNKNCTRATKLIALRKFFGYLAYEDILPENITAQIPKPKIPKLFVQKFSKEDVLKFFGAVEINTERGIRDAVILILAVFCGMRVGEIVGLNMGDVVDDDGALFIVIRDGKHNSFREVSLWKAPALFVKQLLSIRMAQGAGVYDPFIVSYRRGDHVAGHRLTGVAIGEGIKIYAAKAGLRKLKVNPHMFRATHASDLRHIRGYDIAAIADRLGHKHIASTDRYLPSRERISREYRSLAEYWHEFPTIWTRKEEKEGEGGKSEIRNQKSEIRN